MNILFFLTPKAMCAYIESDDTLRQAMERMEHSGYAALPVLDKSGKYCGVVTEGDLLWTLKRLCVMDLRQTEEHSISEIEHRRTVQPVRVDTRVEDLISVAADQNFVPVVDDKGDFIGIVTRSRILKYCLQTNRRRIRNFFREKGYYIVLGLCVCAVGVSGWLFVSNAVSEKRSLQSETLSIATSAEDPQASRSSGGKTAPTTAPPKRPRLPPP